MSEMTRRDFMSTIGAAAVAMGAGAVASTAPAAKVALAEEAAANGFVPGGGSFAEGALNLGWTGTPLEIETVGGCTMPLAELQRRRKAHIDSKTEDWVCEDGEVIPVVFVKASLQPCAGCPSRQGP